MATLYSKQLVRVKGLSGAELDVPMPPGVVWVIRDVSGYRNNISANTLTISTLDDAVGFFQLNDLPDQEGSFHQEYRLVLEPGAPGGFKIVAAGFGAYDVIVSGYQLSVP